MSTFAFTAPLVAAWGVAAAAAAGPPPPSLQEESSILPTFACGDAFIAPVVVNGSGPYAMLLDSAAPVTVVAPEVAGWAGIGRTIDELRIGGLRQGGLRVEVRDLEALGQSLGATIQGIVGMPAFAGVLLTFDYPRHEVSVSKGFLDAGAAGTVSLIAGGRPLVEAAIGDRRLAVLVDTGWAGTLGVPDAAGLEWLVEPRPCGATTRTDATFHAADLGRLDGDVSIGPLTLRQPVTCIAPSGGGGGEALLGTAVLRYFAVTFDQRSGLVRFRLPGDPPLVAPIDSGPWCGIGAAMAATDQSIMVLEVYPGSPAERAGLRAGDTITSIDGRDVGSLDCGYRIIGGGKPGQARLTVMRDGAARSYVVPVEALVP